MHNVKRTVFKLSCLAVLVFGVMAVNGCRDDIEYEDDHHPRHDRYDRHNHHDRDRDEVQGRGRLLFSNKGCNMSRVTAYWDGRRCSRVSNVPDKDGYYIIKDLPRNEKVLLVAEFDYYSARYHASETVRTPRRGGKCDLGTMSFRKVDNDRHRRPDRHDRGRDRHRSVRVQGWVSYQGAAVNDVKVFVKSDRTPVWKEVAQTDRVGRFVVKDVPTRDKVEVKFVKDTRYGTYSAERRFNTSDDDKDLGTVRLRYSEKKVPDRGKDHRHGRGPTVFSNIEGWVEHDGRPVGGVTVYAKLDGRWVVKGKTDRHGRFRLAKMPYDEKVELKFLRDTRQGTYEAKKKVKTKKEFNDTGKIKLKFKKR